MGQNTQEKMINSSSKFTVKNFAMRNRESGAWPSSESAIWALKAHAHENGFGEAFIHVGRRVLIDEGKFWDAVDKLQKVKNVSKG
jgi:hypothetical protein